MPNAAEQAQKLVMIQCIIEVCGCSEKKIIENLLERSTETLRTNDKKKNMFMSEKPLSMYFQLIIPANRAVGKMAVAAERKLDSKRVW